MFLRSLPWRCLGFSYAFIIIPDYVRVLQINAVRGVNYKNRYRPFKTCLKNYKVLLHVDFSKNVWSLWKRHTHTFNDCTEFEACQVRHMKCVDYTKWVPYYYVQATRHLPYYTVQAGYTLCNPPNKLHNCWLVKRCYI